MAITPSGIMAYGACAPTAADQLTWKATTSSPKTRFALLSRTLGKPQGGDIGVGAWLSQPCRNEELDG
jgi:hypothetical protein